jgi:DNA-directed RNA polymerase subunit F
MNKICDACGSNEDVNPLTDNVSLCENCPAENRKKHIENHVELYEVLETVNTRRTISQLCVHIDLQVRVMSQDPRIDTLSIPIKPLVHTVCLLWTFDRNEVEETDYQSVLEALSEVIESYCINDIKRIREGENKKLVMLDSGMRDRRFISGEYASGEQMYKAGQYLFGYNQELMDDEFSFTYQEVVRFIEKIEEKSQEARNKVVDSLLEKPKIQQSIRAEINNRINDTVQFTTQDNVAEAIESVNYRHLDNIWLHNNKIDENYDIIKNISSPIGTNAGEAIGINKNLPYRLPYDIKPIERSFLVQDCKNQQYLPPALHQAFDTIFSSLYDRFKTRILNEESEHLGDYVEKYVENSLVQVFGSSNVWRGVDIELMDETERDVLVAFEDNLIIFSCKAKKIRNESHSGAGDSTIQKVKSDFKNGAGEGYQQAVDLAKSVQNGFDKEKWSIEVDPEKFNTIIPCVILGGKYDRLATGQYELIPYPFHESAYICSVYDLDAICRMVDNEKKFLSYMHDRINLIEQDFISINKDELDYFWAGHHGLLNNTFLDALSNVTEDDIPTPPEPHNVMKLVAELYSSGILEDKDADDLAISKSAYRSSIKLLFGDDGTVEFVEFPEYGAVVRNLSISDDPRE